MHHIFAEDEPFSVSRIFQKRGKTGVIRIFALLAACFLAVKLFIPWHFTPTTFIPSQNTTILASPIIEDSADISIKIHNWQPKPSHTDSTEAPSITKTHIESKTYSPALNGPPTHSFRDNLRPDLHYITSWPSAGWTNDVMTFANLIYLAIITQRIPIIPHFTPGHVHGNIAFGEIFDVPRLSEVIGLPVLEWHEVKVNQSSVVDPLGCWNLWESVDDRNHNPRFSEAPGHLKIDLSYTRAPSWIRLRPDIHNAHHATFWSLARLTFPEALPETQVPTSPAPLTGIELKPDPQLMCFDFLYYTAAANQVYEFNYDYSPAWHFVATHMHWRSSVKELAFQFLQKMMNISENETLPPWITIHVRHNDFSDLCGEYSIQDCYASLPVIARRVQEVKDEIFEKFGVKVEHVIMTSDDKDPNWWKDVASYGWLIPDHTNTISQYGQWYPVIFDAIIQSMGLGFVGTDGSTMSLIAARRVQDWQKGATRMVKWGSPGADDH